MPLLALKMEDTWVKYAREASRTWERPPASSQGGSRDLSPVASQN